MDSASAKLLSQPDSSIFYARRAYELAKDNSNVWAMVKSLTYIGRVEERKGSIDEAIRLYFDALRLMDMADTLDDYNTATLNRNIALIQGRYFNFEQALSYYDSSLFYLNRHVREYPKIAKEDGDYRHLYAIQYFKGQTLRKLGTTEAAKDAFKTLLEDSQTPASIQINSIYQIGLMYNDINLPDSAQKYFRLGLKHPRLDATRRGRGMHNLGMVSFQKGDFQTAIQHYEEALQVKRNLKSKRSLYITLMDLGESYLMLDRFSLADQYFQQALNLLEEAEIKSDPKYYNIYQLRSQALITADASLSRKMLRAYVDCNREFQRIQQQLRDQDQNRAFNLDLDNYWADIDHQEEVIEIQARFRWKLIIVSFIIIALAYAAHYFWRIRKRKTIDRKVKKAVREKRARLS